MPSTEGWHCSYRRKAGGERVAVGLSTRTHAWLSLRPDQARQAVCQVSNTLLKEASLAPSPSTCCGPAVCNACSGLVGQGRTISRGCQEFLRTLCFWVGASLPHWLREIWEDHLESKVCLKMTGIHFTLHCKNTGLKVPWLKVVVILTLRGSENFENLRKALTLESTHKNIH